MAARRPDDARSRAPVEGRLDLDALDAGDEPLDLDVIGEDRSTARESVAGWFDRLGPAALVARHRRAAVAVGVVAALLLASGAVWWARRPAPLPAPRVVAKAAGAEPTAALVPDPASGQYAAVQQQLVVTSTEAPGVAVRLLGLEGPGLAASDRGPGLDLGPSTDGRVAVGSGLACTSPEATTAALSSSASDYGLVVQRTSPSGEVRVDRVPIVGSATLVDVVHRGCLQVALDRDLLVRGISAAPVAGVVALRLDIDLSNPSPRNWSGLHVAASAQPVVTNDGAQVQLEPGTSGRIRAVYWPQDCADPVGPLRGGLAVEADLGPSGLSPSQSPSASSVLLRLPGAMLDGVADEATALCGTTPPRGTVTWARDREGGGNGSGGVIDLGLSLTTPGAGIVEVDHLGDGSTTVGELFAYESPVHAVDGVATIKAQWRLPACAAIVRDGLPRLHVVLAGDVRRPYLVPLSGEALRPVLARLCGHEVASLLG